MIMTSKVSAGILLYRRRDDTIEVFLVHPGGPLWAAKDIGAWSIPKGLVEPGEDHFPAAQREFHEETGCTVSGHPIPLTPIKTKSGKTIYAWAVTGDCDPAKIRSNTFTMEWPPHSGRYGEFPEIDRAGWFPIEDAKRKIHPGQVALIDELEKKLGDGESEKVPAKTARLR